MNKLENYPKLSIINLSLAAKRQASEFCRYQSQTDKAKQVYLNTLAIWTVNLYLNTQGWATDLTNSQSWNPVYQTLLDISDLEIPNYGKLECRFVLPNSRYLEVPLEARKSRIAIVAVGLNESLSQAKLLGFTPVFARERLPLKKLKPIDELTNYLNQQEQNDRSRQPISLSLWRQKHFSSDWQSLETLFTDNLAFGVRSHQSLNTKSGTNLAADLSRVKVLEFNRQDRTQDIALIVELLKPRNDDLTIDILIKICPTNERQFLPVGLNSLIIDDTQKTIMQARCRDREETEIIEFHFNGEPGETFSVEISWNNLTKVENFII